MDCNPAITFTSQTSNCKGKYQICLTGNASVASLGLLRSILLRILNVTTLLPFWNFPGIISIYFKSLALGQTFPLPPYASM